MVCQAGERMPFHLVCFNVPPKLLKYRHNKAITLKMSIHLSIRELILQDMQCFSMPVILFYCNAKTLRKKIMKYQHLCKHGQKQNKC